MAKELTEITKTQVGAAFRSSAHVSNLVDAYLANLASIYDTSVEQIAKHVSCKIDIQFEFADVVKFTGENFDVLPADNYRQQRRVGFAKEPEYKEPGLLKKLWLVLGAGDRRGGFL